MYADVIVDITNERLDKTFQYLVPETMEKTLKPGMQVWFPFGRGNREQKGFVLELKERPDFDPEKTKALTRIAEESVSVEGELIALAAWIRENYGSTMIQALKTVLPVRDKVRGVERVTFVPARSEEEMQAYLTLCIRNNYRARVRLLKALKEEGSLTLPEAEARGISRKALKDLKESGYVCALRETVYRNPVSRADKAYERKTLSGEQQQAVDCFCRDYASGIRRVYLLHGVTGSGKTEVYLEVMDQVIAQGKQVIVLIPEIALTYQTLIRFYTRFGGRVSVINSRMSQGERYDQFERARNGEIDIMIGPRSALFTPFSHLGLIIIDEEHEASYKSENTPRYHARETAVQRANMCGASVMLGSATPSMESYYRAKTGEYRLLTLTKRVEERPLPKVYIEDMREELKAGNRSVFSRHLRALMEDRLQKGQQMMLFLNRRGYAGFLSCRSCGGVIKCPHCDVSLSVHRGKGRQKLVCHYCGHEQEMMNRCPSCGSGYISELKAGTQQIEELVQREFPGARVLRMDMDTTRRKGEHAKILSAFSERQADILIGTQMIVKGHDFPGVTLMGVLAADMSLFAGDYRASERTFQLLTQAAGRAGRGTDPGEVVIQTYQPDHYSIVMAVEQNYESFYEQELIFRRMLKYPPGAHMLAILMSCEDESHLTVGAEYLKKMIVHLYKGKDMQVIGPAEGGISRVKDRYRKNIFIKHEDYTLLTRIKDRLEQYIEANEGFDTIQIQFDFNPMNLL